jgi:hypothetical protein
MPKHVASRGAPLDWNATAIEGDAVGEVRKLKAAHACDLVMSGCGELARELIQAGLVDNCTFGSTRASRDQAAAITLQAAALTRRERCHHHPSGTATITQPATPKPSQNATMSQTPVNGVPRHHTRAGEGTRTPNLLFSAGRTGVLWRGAIVWRLAW